MPKISTQGIKSRLPICSSPSSSKIHNCFRALAQIFNVLLAPAIHALLAPGVLLPEHTLQHLGLGPPALQRLVHLFNALLVVFEWRVRQQKRKRLHVLYRARVLERARGPHAATALQASELHKLFKALFEPKDAALRAARNLAVALAELVAFGVETGGVLEWAHGKSRRRYLLFFEREQAVKEVCHCDYVVRANGARERVRWSSR